MHTQPYKQNKQREKKNFHIKCHIDRSRGTTLTSSPKRVSYTDMHQQVWSLFFEQIVLDFLDHQEYTLRSAQLILLTQSAPTS